MKPVRPIWWTTSRNKSTDLGFIPWDYFQRDFKRFTVMSSTVNVEVDKELQVDNNRIRGNIVGMVNDATHS